MEIQNVCSPAFTPYGRVHTGYDMGPLLTAMETIPLPEQGTDYRPSIPALEAAGCFRALEDRAYGGMPIQIGMCWGRNNRLNCLEYHRGSEFNVGTGEFVLLLAHQWELEDGKLDTARVNAFRVPAGTLVEIYGTTLHYAPCHADGEAGFRVAVILPRGTNTEAPAHSAAGEDGLLWARNKWLLAHPDSPEAGAGAYVGLTGENIAINIVKERIL